MVTGARCQRSRSRIARAAFWAGPPRSISVADLTRQFRGAIAEKAVKKGDVAWFEPGGGDEISIAADGPFRLLLFSSEPIDEPVVAYGPFVMNTREEIVRAFEDYQAGRLVA